MYILVCVVQVGLYRVPCYFTDRSLPSHPCSFRAGPGKCIKDEWDRMVAQTSFFKRKFRDSDEDLRGNKFLVSKIFVSWKNVSCYSSETALKPTEMSTQNDGKVLFLYHNSSEEDIEFFFSGK